MSRPSERGSRQISSFLSILLSIGVSIITLVVLSSAANARQPADDSLVSTPEAIVEEYLSDRGLQDLLATQLRHRLVYSVGPDRIAIAERLGRLYVDRLSKVTSPDDRQELEKASRELFKLVPEADSFELRIDLAKVGYLRAENMAERERLKLASPEERSEAERVLRSVAPMFQEIGAKVGRKVESLERKDQAGRDEEGLKEQLNSARRVRSLAMYYNGWTNYYLAFLTGNPALAARSLEDFGYILNAVPGKPASIERMPVALLKFDHVARAAVGCALSAALKPGGDAEALRWLDTIQAAEGLSPAVSGELFRYRAVVLAGSKRWSDLNSFVRRRLKAPQGGKATPLSPVEARLLAVLTLDATDANKKPAANSADIIATLAQVALGELVTQGRVGDVLDLVQHYGTAPIGQDGFIVQFVRGLQTYERARTEHTAAGNSSDLATDAGVINRYREAAKVIQLAVESADGSKFPAERAHASMMLGRALYYAGEMKAASDQFQKTAQATQDLKLREEATWLAIVSLDRAVDAGDRTFVGDRDRLATLFLNTYARSPNASVLLLRRAGSGLLSDDATIQILSEVSPDSPLHSVAQRQIAEILFKAVRKSAPADRDAKGRAFLDAAEQALKLAFRDATAGGATNPSEPAQAALRSARQIAEVALSLVPPDAARAEAALDAIDQLGQFVKLDVASIEDELMYRRVQVAVERGRTDLSEPLIAKLRGRGGPFAVAADRAVLRSALVAWRAAPTSVSLATAVVSSGSRVADSLAAKPGAADDPNNQSIFNDVAEAARVLWRANKQPSIRDLALKFDRLLVASRTPPASALQRYAELSEEAGDPTAALESWRRLLSGLDPTKPDWFEARYNSIRLLIKADSNSAREVLAQHKMLNPDMGPEPWGSKLRDLDSTLGNLAPTPTPAPISPPTDQPGAGGGL